MPLVCLRDNDGRELVSTTECFGVLLYDVVVERFEHAGLVGIALDFQLPRSDTVTSRLEGLFRFQHRVTDATVVPILTTPLPPLSHEDAAWFWDHVQKSDDADGCWTLQPGVGHADEDGYLRVRLPGHPRAVLAHRLALALDGRDPGDLLALHLCDEPSCLRLDHLTVGTAAENARQRDLRGRRRPAKGADSPTARLTWREAEAVRRAKAAGVPAEVLAHAFNVSRSTVYAIVGGSAYLSDPPSGDATG